MRARFTLALTIATMLACAAPAHADSTASSNWAGYAAHRPGVSFHQVSAAWREPNAYCRRGDQTYSAMWVGLGGFSLGSQALEQTGTELDCSFSGRAVVSAWYELLPAPSRRIALTVRPGDAINASVSVTGDRVVLSLQDLARHERFQKTAQTRWIDTSSADWIVEAPSECFSLTSCQTLPLADFGSASFQLAGAQSAGGHSGSISDPAWGWTRIALEPDGGRRAAGSPAAGAATPSALRAGGTSFAVTFSRVPTEQSPYFSARGAPLAPGYLVHPLR